MYDYAVRKLHMSEGEAAVRIRVARLGREFPVALEMLGRGELHLIVCDRAGKACEV